MDKYIAMTKKEIKKYDIIKRLLNKELNGAEASGLLGLTARHLRRLNKKDFWEKAKDKGISDDNTGRRLMEKALRFLNKRGNIELADAEPFWENSLISIKNKQKIE